MTTPPSQQPTERKVEPTEAGQPKVIRDLLANGYRRYESERMSASCLYQRQIRKGVFINVWHYERDHEDLPPTQEIQCSFQRSDDVWATVSLYSLPHNWTAQLLVFEDTLLHAFRELDGVPQE